jgi:hypothetical protein
MRRFLALLCAGVLTLALAPIALAFAPTNDEQVAATVVTVTPAVPFTTSQDTTEATPNATDPVWMQTSDEWVGELPTPIGPTVWYVYTAAESGTFSFNLTASDYSSIMLVLQSDGTVVDYAFGSITREVLAGQTYYFVIGDIDVSDGVGGLLHVSASILPAPVNAQIGVTGATIVDGQLVVTGTLVATGGDSIWVNLRVEAAQTGKAPATGDSSIADPGETWTVSVPTSTNPWRAVRTTLTVRADYYQDPDEYPDGTFTYVGTLRADQAPAPELGNVSGRFTFTDDATGKAVGIVVDLQRISPEWDTAPAGSLAIKSGSFAGRYEPAVLNLYEVDGDSMAMIGVVLPDGQRMNVALWAYADGSGSVEIELLDSSFNLLDSMTGTVARKGFTITMPTPM